MRSATDFGRKEPFPNLFYCGLCRGKAVATWAPPICGVGYLMPTSAGVVQRRLLFVVVVRAKCVVVLLFLFEHFGTVQCPTLSSLTSFRIVPCGEENMQYEYQCAEVQLAGCPWQTSTNRDYVLQCGNGAMCNGEMEGWSCCNDKGKRARCPLNTPHMCATPNECAGGQDHCCAQNCEEGNRPCSGICGWM